MTAGAIITLDLPGMAHAALHVAMESPAGEPVQMAMVGLVCAMKRYSAAYADVAGDPFGRVLWASAEALADATDRLIEALAAQGGTEDEIENAVAGVAAK